MSTTTTTPGSAGNAGREYEKDARRTEEALERERQAAERVGHEARGAAKQAADQARHAAEGFADEGRDLAASGLRDFSDAISAAGRTLSERDQGLAASFAKQAAEGLSDLSRSISGRSVEDVVRGTASFARRNPTTFLAGAALAGVALGRFVKATGERDHHRHHGGHEQGVPTGHGTTAVPTAAAGRPAAPARPASPPTAGTPATGSVSPSYRPGGPGASQEIR